MKNKYQTLLLVLWILSLQHIVIAQSSFNIQLDTFSIADMPGLHSFAYAQQDGKILLLGGRRDGLHDKFNAFNKDFANTDIFVVDLKEKQVWTASNKVLPITIQEQLQSTNMEFYQEDKHLIFIGGYGRSDSKENHITHPALISIDVSNLMAAIIAGTDITPYFQQLEDDYFAVAGGGLEKIGDTYYLVGGHLFDGLYASGWSGNVTQIYTDAIRKFKISITNDSIAIRDKEEIKDQFNLHRRDYNLVPQIMQNGKLGLTIFSGVFQAGNAPLPYLNLVNISETEHSLVENFNQYLTQYHSAKFPVFDATTNEMHTFFFGGMSQYVTDVNGELKQDNRIPFTKSISRITRDATGNYEESKLASEMPFYVGTNAEFILNPEIPQLENGIIDWSKISSDTTFIGYIFGGIETPETDINPYVDNKAHLTSASNVFFKVYLIGKALFSTTEIVLKGQFDLNMKLFPNPAEDHINVGLEIQKPSTIRYILQNTEGKILQEWTLEKQQTGAHQHRLEIDNLASGIYFLTANVDGVYMSTKQFYK